MKGVDKWLVIGGRRWARIIANELCIMLGQQTPVMMLGEPGDIDLLGWLKNNPHKEQLKIIDQIESCCPSEVGVAIVANSAYLHCSSSEIALDAGYNVVSEKPMTLSLAESRALLAKAEKLGLKFFSTNTYLFADYLRIFRQNWLSGQKISHIDIQWADMAAESRYGERKMYDSSVPIIYDVLPHIASIILASYGEVKILKSIIKVLKGGSEVELRIMCEDLVITISLARNSIQRKRLIHFSGPGLDVSLDFTEEPGVVFSTKEFLGVSDLGWTSKPKPIAEMLSCVKNFFEGGTMDRRLCSDAALLGNQLIDSVAEDYVGQQISFLNLARDSKVADDLHVVYARKESASLNKRVLQHLSNGSFLRPFSLKSQ